MITATNIAMLYLFLGAGFFLYGLPEFVKKLKKLRNHMGFLKLTWVASLYTVGSITAWPFLLLVRRRIRQTVAPVVAQHVLGASLRWRQDTPEEEL